MFYWGIRFWIRDGGVVFISFLDYNEVVICMVDFIDMFFSHFFSEAKRNARKESAWYVEVIPLTKWLKMAPPSLKRPNSQVCRNLFGFSRLDLNAFFFTEVRRCPRSDSGRFLT